MRQQHGPVMCSPVHHDDVGGVPSLCRSAIKVFHVVGLHTFGAELLFTLCVALLALMAAVHHEPNTGSVTNCELANFWANCCHNADNLMPASIFADLYGDTC